MDSEHIERLATACVIIGAELAKAAATMTNAFAVAAEQFADNNIAEALGHFEVDSITELQEEIERIRALFYNGDLADDLDFIIPSKKLPRPQKRIGSVNKANYTANRPRRQARSSCRIIKR